MATKGKDVHALYPKIVAMAETLCELGQITAASPVTFADYAGIDYHTLKTSWRSGRLSIPVERKLFTAAGFDPADPTWIDDNIDPKMRGRADNRTFPGRDTTAAFRAMLRQRHGLSGMGTAVRVANTRPQLIDSNLATFSVDDSGQESTLGEPTPMLFSIVLERGYHPKGIEYGFQRVRFRLVFSDDSQARIRERLGHTKTVEINGAIVEVRGNEHHPEWFLRVDRSILEGEYTTKNDPLCFLSGLQLGEEFGAELSVRPKDGALVAVDGAPLPDLHKKRIIEVLCAKRLPSAPDTQGWLSLGWQKLRVIRADQL